jgi:hypothetical protein
MDYQQICKFIGQLYLESRFQADQLENQLRDANHQLMQLQKERDEALRMACGKNDSSPESYRDR